MDQKEQGAVAANDPIDVQALLHLNNLVYEMEPSLSVCSSRQMKTYIPEQPGEGFELGRDKINIQLTSGASFVDLKNSTLSFEVRFSGFGTDEVAPSFPGTLGEFAQEGGSVLQIPAHAGYQQLFSRVRLTHATGQEIDRQQNVGEWTQLRNYYDQSAEWRDTVAKPLWKHNSTGGAFKPTNQEHGPIGPSNATGFPSAKSTREGSDLRDESWGYPITLKLGRFGLQNDFTQRVTLPLGELIDCFRDKNELCPPYLLSGLQIQLETYSKETFFIRTPTTAVQRAIYPLHPDDETPWFKLKVVDPPEDKKGAWGLEPYPVGSKVLIGDVKVNLCSYTLTDAVSRRVAQVSSEKGLDWTWKAIANQTLLTKENEINMKVSKAISRADMFIVKARLSQNLNNQFTDSFSSLPWVDPMVKSYAGRFSTLPPFFDDVRMTSDSTNLDGTCVGMQVRLGAEYYPAQPMGRQGKQQFIHSALQSFNAMRRNDAAVGPTAEQFSGVVRSIGKQYQTIDGSGDPFADRFVSGAVVALDGSYPALYSSCVGIYAIPLETNPDLKQSGLAISAQRTAEINMEFLDAGADPKLRRYDLFIPHTKVASLWLGDQCIVRD